MKQEMLALARTNGSSMRAELFLPDSHVQPAPAVVLIFDVFGITPDLARIAGRFVAEGYAVIVPDLFDHPGPKFFCVVSAIRSLMRGEGREFRDIELARKYMTTRPEIDPRKIAITGFCLGGGFAILVANSGAYKVSAPFYGEVPKSVDKLRGSCPMVASYGLRDSGSMVKSGKRLEGFLEELAVPHDVKFYPEAGHGFMHHNTGFLAEKIAPHLPIHAEYHEASAEDAFRRIFQFFKTHLNAD
jgi:carboxymethylenebutenolidase